MKTASFFKSKYSYIHKKVTLQIYSYESVKILTSESMPTNNVIYNWNQYLS